ncbi:hypothetical protein OH807_35575 [Kitasatospora sp. NBC_01560]|uniref:hypothetical protein n=1 Tax=Kitasatospora sp. NBC_01560 TaxID=2975965 RepID=UPI00386F7EB8
MADYSSDSLVAVRPFTRRLDGDSATIGDLDREVFLAIPVEGLDILDALAEGLTVGEAARRYEERHDEVPDIEDFLAALEEEGFVGAADGTDPQPAGAGTAAAPERRTARRSWALAGLTPETARRLVGRPVLTAFGIVIALGLVAQAADPAIVPTPGALFYTDYFGVLTWATFACALVGIAVHEFGHVVAARAAGVPSRLGIGNQMYFMVATTDMSGILLAPKRRRYLAFMIGSILDLVSYSVLAGVQWGGRHGLYELPRWATLLIGGVMLTYSTRVVWQWFFFLRTDGYYVISTLLNCRSLMADTQDYLYNLTVRFRRSAHRVDQSGVPRREMRIVRGFAVFWLTGRLMFLALLFTVALPLLWKYLEQVGLWVVGGGSRFSSFDFATVVILAFLVDGGGVVLWLRSLYRGARARRARLAAADAV